MDMFSHIVVMGLTLGGIIMQFQAYNKIMICNETIKNFVVEGIKLGYQFQIRYPSYRGTFLSCIEKLEFCIDSKKIDSSKVRININGKQFLIEELKDQYKEYWFILDRAMITVMQDGGISKGEHKVTVDMFHRIPYAGYDGHYLALPSVVTKTLMAE